MKITSLVFEHNQSIPAKYTCDGEDINPALKFDDVPVEAKSLVLIMDDPDAPAGVWDHWIVFNIPLTVKEVFEDEQAPGVQGTNSSGSLNYHGPCPPDREHRYFFKLYALDNMLDLPEGATKQEVEQAMQNHVLAQAELMGRYARQ